MKIYDVPTVCETHPSERAASEASARDAAAVAVTDETNVITIQQTFQGWVIRHLEHPPHTALDIVETKGVALVEAYSWADTWGAKVETLPPQPLLGTGFALTKRDVQR